MISVEGVSTYPLLCLRDHEIYFGLVRTFTTVRKAVTITNEQNNLVYFRVHNPFRFYALDFYCFY